MDGVEGEKGEAGTGLTLKTFTIDNSYSKGDYVFVNGKMYVAQKDFVTIVTPDNDTVNWVQVKGVKCSPWCERNTRC